MKYVKLTHEEETRVRNRQGWTYVLRYEENQTFSSLEYPDKWVQMQICPMPYRVESELGRIGFARWKLNLFNDVDITKIDSLLFN